MAVAWPASLLKNQEALSPACRARGREILESDHEAGKGEHVAVTHVDVMGYFVTVDDLKSIEAVRRNEATPVLEGSTLGRLF